MESNSSHNQGYWFVLREDQGNVIFSSNSLPSTAPNPQIAAVSESRYVVDSATGRLYGEPAVDTAWDSDSHKRKEDFWDHNKIKLLLTLCLENKGIEKEALWEDIGSVVGAPADECSARYRQLRRTYLRLLKKKALGKHIKWPHFSACEEVFTRLGALPAAALEPWAEPRVRSLLTLYLEHLPRFRDPQCLQKDLWKDIATKLGSTTYNCYHKFKNLKRSYFNWLARSRQTGKTMKWPYQQYFARIYYNYHPNTVKPWERNKIKNLLEAYAEIAHKFRNPKFQKKDLWKEISVKVGETPSVCDKKFRNLKQTYLRLKAKADCGRLTTKWRYYRDFEQIYSNATRYIDMDGSKIVYRSDLDEDYVKLLLSFYIENKSKFRDPLTKNKTLWRVIGPKLGLTIEECDKKFRNLKQTYLRLAWKKRQTGKCIKWPYFGYFEQIYSDAEPTNGSESTEDVCSAVTRATQISRVRRELFQRLTAAAEESNAVQRHRNVILQAMLDRRK